MVTDESKKIMHPYVLRAIEVIESNSETIPTNWVNMLALRFHRNEISEDEMKIGVNSYCRGLLAVGVFSISDMGRVEGYIND